MYVMQTAALLGWVFGESHLPSRIPTPACTRVSHIVASLDFLRVGYCILQADELMNVCCNVCCNLFHSCVVRFIEGSGRESVSQSAALMQVQY